MRVHLTKPDGAERCFKMHVALARKVYRCAVCSEPIAVGSRYAIDGNNATRIHEAHISDEADGSAVRVTSHERSCAAYNGNRFALPA